MHVSCMSNASNPHACNLLQHFACCMQAPKEANKGPSSKDKRLEILARATKNQYSLLARELVLEKPVHVILSLIRP